MYLDNKATFSDWCLSSCPLPPHMHEACSYDMKLAPVIDSLKRAHRHTEIYVHPAPCRAFLWCQERKKKTLPQAVQSINTGPGLQTKHTLIIVGQPHENLWIHVYYYCKKQQTSAPYILDQLYAAFRDGLSTVWLVSLFRFGIRLVFLHQLVWLWTYFAHSLRIVNDCLISCCLTI